MSKLTEVALLRVRVRGKLIYKAAWWGLADGRRRRLTETIGPVSSMRRKDAKLVCAQKQAAITKGQATPDRLGRLTLAAFLDRDRQGAARDLKATSLRELHKAGDYAEAALGSAVDVHRVDAAAVARIRQHLQAKQLAPATVAKHLSYLQGAFRRGVDLGTIHGNPFAGMRRPKFQTPRAKVFSADETGAVLGVCHDRDDLWWEAFVLLGLTSGLRRGELVHLLWASVDFDEATATVNPQKSGAFTIGGERYPLLAWESKDYETRVIPLPVETIDLLRRFKAKAGVSPYVFLTLDRLGAIGRHLDANGGAVGPDYPIIPNLSRDFGVIQRQARDRLSRQAGGKRIAWPTRSLKHLRSTYASRMVEHVAAFELRDLLGHSSVTTTERHYVAASAGLGDRVRAGFAKATSDETSSLA